MANTVNIIASRMARAVRQLFGRGDVPAERSIAPREGSKATQRRAEGRWENEGGAPPAPAEDETDAHA